jgi:hypothetical protein
MSEYRGIDLVQGHDRKSWHPRNGWVIGRPYTGSQTKIELAANAAFLAGDPFDLNPGRNGDEWELVIYFGAEETQSPDAAISDTWELDGNELEKDLWELPWILDEFKSIKDNRQGNPTGDPRLASAACINWIRRNIEAWFRGESKMITLDPEERDLSFAELHQNCIAYGLHEDAFNKIVHLFGMGRKAFPVSQFVLRRTRVVANNFNKSNITNIYDDVFKRRLTSSLESAENIPATLRFALPAGEWVKRTPDMLQTTANKWTIREEWWHADKWDEEIYGPLI